MEKDFKINELLDLSRSNLNIYDAFAKADQVINNSKYKNIMCSISGGSDSDIMMDILYKVDNEKKIKYVWFDTGLEYEATKKHLKYLEEKYGIKIYRERAVKPIPVSCREYGVPFISKQVNEYIARAQRHGFKFEDKPYDELLKEYPEIRSVCKWWTNRLGDGRLGSKFNVERNKWLKEFLIENPPKFKISNLCCHYAKKQVAKKYIKENSIDLNVFGIRKSEGGARSSAYKSCFESGKENEPDRYLPIFWFLNEDKKEYENIFDIKHSECYTKYGMDRTGCAGCPYSKKFEQDLETMKIYEPKLYKAVNNIFGESYEYTRKYKEFQSKMNEKKNNENQIKLFD